MRVDFRHCQVLDPVGSAVAFPKSIEFWKDRRMPIETKSFVPTCQSESDVSAPRWCHCVVSARGRPARLQKLQAPSPSTCRLVAPQAMAAVPPLETVADDGAAGLAEDSDAVAPASDSGGSDSDSSRMRIRCAALEVELEHERRARATAESAAQSLRREVCHHAGLACAGLGRLRVAWQHEQRRSAAATLMMSHRLGLGHTAHPAPRSASAELRREMAAAARSVASLAQLPAVTIIQAATRGFLTRRLVNGAAP
jgi:hypothetical protein